MHPSSDPSSDPASAPSLPSPETALPSGQLLLPPILSTSEPVLSTPEQAFERVPASESVEGLLRALLDFKRQPPPEALHHHLSAMDADPTDFLLSPMSARVGALGVQAGCLFFHHELRRRVPHPEALLPTVDLTEPALPEWQNGILTEARYFSFGQEAQLQCFNPNHRRQWRPHEVLHALSRFFWAPDMTSFELYLGARLNELLPIVHWYGWDEALRPTCPNHRGISRYQLHCPDCEEIQTAYYEGGQDPAQMDSRFLDAARTFLAHGLDHWQSEWRACLEELSTGRRKEIPRGTLNASSDAVGYVLGHWNRLTSWSFGRWVETCLVEGVDYFSRVDGLAQHLVGLHGQLFTQPVVIQLLEVRARQLRRLLLDTAQRHLLALEWLGEGSKKLKEAEKLLAPFLSEVNQLSPQLRGTGANARQGLLTQTEPRDAELNTSCIRALQALVQLQDVQGALTKLLPKAVAEALPAQGIRVAALRRLQVMTPSLGDAFAPLLKTASAGACGSLKEGLASVSRVQVGIPPVGRTARVPTITEAHLDEFIHQPIFLENRSMIQRLSAHAHAGPTASFSPEALLQLQWDAFMTTGIGRDGEGERFGVVPEVDELARLMQTSAFWGALRPNSTLRRGLFSAGWVEKQLNVDSGEPASNPVEVLVFTWEGEVIATLLEEGPGETSGRRLLDHLKAQEAATEGQSLSPSELPAALLLRLLEAGALVYMPRPRLRG